jgi:hypothetical protein
MPNGSFSKAGISCFYDREVLNATSDRADISKQHNYEL